MPTSTVENYLKAILVRSSGEDDVVSTGALAEALGVTPGTITTMVKSMASRGLLEHQPREGVRLTPDGRALALAVVRKHRLVETFLVQVLKMDWKEVHEEAEALEHAISDRVLLRIDAILGHPAADPHGDPIPSRRSPLLDRGKGVTLATCELQRPLRVERILDQSPAFLGFIQRSGLMPGARIRVRERDPASGVVRCELKDAEASLGLPEAAKIAVAPA
ncbi:MAG: metal-dependent transcriptional regulator [Opitutaceae bacterium]|jgi:DtxR family Mn-dependent transcriptional regulator